MFFIVASVLNCVLLLLLLLLEGFSKFLCLPFKHVENEMKKIRQRLQAKILDLRNFGGK